MQRNLKCLIIKPNKIPIYSEIPNTLKAKQKIVGGNIEYAYIENDDKVCFICNDEGKMRGLKPNRSIKYDILVGDIILVGFDLEMGEDRSLTVEQIDYYTKYFGKKSIKETEKHLFSLMMKNYEYKV